MIIPEELQKELLEYARSLEPKIATSEIKVWFMISLKYRKLLHESETYMEAMTKWQEILPEELSRYALTIDAWERISEICDNDDTLNALLDKVAEKLFGES